jgi:hypothetical protein
VADFLREVHPSEPFRETADFRNAVIGMLREHLQGRQQFKSTVNDTPVNRVKPIWMRNDRGSAIDWCGVVGIGGILNSPQDNLSEFQSRVALKTAAPTAGERFAVALESAPDGEILQATMTGVVPCQINRTDAAHDYADAATGDYAKLVSGSTGTAAIIAVDDLPAAAIGETVHSGTGAPSGGLGSDGDYYKDTAASEYYGPKTAGAWGSAHDYGTGICWAVVLLGSAGDAPVTSVNGQTGAVTVEVEGADGTVAVTTTVGASSTTYGLSARVADATHSGILSLTTQTIVGDKTFDDLLRAAYQFETNGVVFYDTDKRITFSGVTGSVTGTAIISATAGDLVPTGATYPLSVRPNYLTGNVVNLADHAFLGDIPDNIYGSVSTTNTTFGILSHSYAVYDYYNVAGAGARWHRGVTNYDPIGNLFVEGVCVSTAGQGASAVPGSPIGVSGNMIAADAVTNAKLANAAAYSFKANLTSVAANPTDVTLADLPPEMPVSGDFLLTILSTGEIGKVDMDDMPGGGNVVGPGSSVNSNFAMFDGVTGELLKDTGLSLDTDGTLAADSDAKIPSQKAVKTFVSTAVSGLLDLKGSTDCSANPNYPAALKGDTYYVTVAGKIGGASGKTVEVGDVYIASVDNAGGNEAAVGTSWFVLEHNVPAGILFSANNLSDLASAATARTNLGATTVGGGFFTLTNPGAITFPRMNADNTVSALSASDFRTAIGAGSGGGDALTTNPLSQFAATTSAQLAGVISDETGSGKLVFGTAPVFASTIEVGTAGGTTGLVKLNGTTSGVVSLTVAAAAGTHTIKLPTGDGSAGQVIKTDGSGQWSWFANGGNTIILQDQKSSGTHGGTFTSGSWVTRTLNTEVTDTGGDCTLSSNQFTLVAGTYEILAMAPGVQVDHHQARLQNITDSTTTLSGTSTYSYSGGGQGETVSIITGRFTITSSKTFEIQHRCSMTAATAGLGSACGGSFTVANELYTNVIIKRVA